MNIDDGKKSRATLKSYFVANSIPTESQFAQVMDGFLNQRDDGLVKMPGDPLSIEAAGDDAGFKKAVNFYTKFSDTSPSWTVALRPRANPADAATGRPGLSFSDGSDRSRLCIDAATGYVGLGVVAPAEPLEVAGRIKSGALTIGPWPASPESYAFFGANTLNQTQAANYALLQGTAGSELGRTYLNSPLDIHFRIKNADQMVLDANGRVGIGTATPQARLQVTGGAIMPSAGNDENSGILFPRDAGGGGGDRAWMRYYPRSGEAMTLEIGISNDADDQISLTSPGGVAVGTGDASPYRMRLAGRPDGGQNQYTLHISPEKVLRGNDSVTHIKFGKDADYQIVHKASGYLNRNSLGFHCDAADAIGIYSTGFVPLLEVEGGTGNTYIRGGLTMENGATVKATGRLHITGDELLYILPKQGVIIGKEWGGTGDLTVGGRLGVGTYTPRAALEVAGGAIMPAAGNSESAGILFPPDPAGGGGDRAWMRYYARSGESMNLEIGTSNDPDDNIVLKPSGEISFHPGGSADRRSYINVNGDYVKSSSERFKDNIAPLSTDEAISILGCLEPVEYVFKADESKRKNLGFIAERTPGLFTSPDGKMLAVDGIIALLTRVVKDQQVAIQNLEAELHTRH
jgi:hypothetical protein